MTTTNGRAARAARTGSSPSTLESRIRSAYDGLPGSETLVADVLLHHPGWLATHSATELAADAGASKAAVTRLVQRLGYASYAAARSEVRDAQRWGSPLYMEGNTREEVGRHAALAEHIAADQQVLARTLASLAETDLDPVIQALGQARRIIVIGFRNSGWLATYARRQIGLLRPGVELAPMPTETLAESLVDLGPDDVLLAIGLRRRVPAFGAALRAAHAASARIVLLTDPSGAATLRFADWTLTCHNRGASRFDSYVAPVSLLNFLIEQLAQSMGDAGRARLQNAEHWHALLADLSG